MKNSLSRVAGRIASLQFPPFIQKKLNRAFVSLMKIDLSDFHAVDAYTSIQKLFTRGLEKPRPFSKKETDLIAPADSTILQHGDIHDNQILQVKGLTYSVAEFLSNQADKKKLQKIEAGQFINFYLSPHDYHRFHSPATLHIHKIIHVPGTLFPVKKSYQEKKKDLFVRNERVILECELVNGEVCYFIAIGALNVGKIKINKEPRLQTNLPGQHDVKTYVYKSPLLIQKGDELGTFEMGSSVVIVFEKNSIHLDQTVKNNRSIKFGETIGKIFS